MFTVAVMRRAFLMVLVAMLVLLPAVLVLSLAKWPSDAPVSVTPTEPMEEPPPRMVHVHRIPANLDPTDDAVLATTVDTRFRHLGPVAVSTVSPCGNRIAALCEAEGVIREWDVCSGEEVRQFKLPKVDDPVEGGPFAEFVLPPQPLILYRDEVNQLLYCSRVGRITTFSTDDTRLLVTYRSSYFDKYPYQSTILSDNGQYHLQPYEDDNCTVIDTGTGGVVGTIPKRERNGFYPGIVSADGIAVFHREKSVRIIHWNSAGPNRVMTIQVPETRKNIFTPFQWIDGHRFMFPVEPLELATVRRQDDHVVEEMPRYAVVDCQLDPPQLPVVLNDVERVRGVQDGLLYCVDDARNPVVFDAKTLKRIHSVVKPWAPAATDALMELSVDVRHSSLAISSACLEHPNLDDDRETRFQQLVLPNGNMLDLVEFGSARNEANHVDFPQLVVTPKGKFGLLGLDRSTRLFAYPGYAQLADIEQDMLKESSDFQAILGVTPAGTVWVPITNKASNGYDCYEIAIPSGELIQKREGNQFLSLDGRWLFSTDKEKLLISNAKLDTNRHFVEDFSTHSFIKRGNPGHTFGIGGQFDDSESSERNPDDIYVTTDGRVFGIRSGSNDNTPHTTITIRHVDHPDWKHLTHYQLPGTGTISDQYEVSFHPNERLLFVILQRPSTTESELRCYELATLHEVFRYRHPRGVTGVKFDRNGLSMLLNHKDGAQSVYDFAKFFARQLKPADAKHWLSDDPVLAIPAMRALAKQADAVDVVQRTLKQPKPDIAADLIALGDANFRSREAATERLR